MKYIYILLIATLIALNTEGQKLEYDINFQGIGDNREYKPEYGFSQTIIGELTSLDIGTTIDKAHKLRLGLTYLYEFGAKTNLNKLQITAYYQFSDKNTQFYFGAFPRAKTINFPFAILADTIQYYKPNIEGLLAKHNWSWGNQTIFVDWTGKRLENNREKFFAGTSGTIYNKNFFAENFISLYHYALSENEHIDEHISDNFGYNINIGYNLPKCSYISNAYIKVGILGSAIRERNVNENFIFGTSFLNEIYVASKKLALKNSINIGNGQHFLTGDKFYLFNNYMRSDFIWNMINREDITLQFIQSFHFINWESMSNQQKISLVYYIGK